MVSYSDRDGGASIASYRLFENLSKVASDTKLLVTAKKSNHPSILSPPTVIDRTLAKLSAPIQYRMIERMYPSCPRGHFSPNIFPDRILKRIQNTKPDIINIHWIGHGSMLPETFSQIDVPIVWTLHDESAYTGGCYYTNDCSRFQKTCGKCPTLRSTKEHDLSRKNYLRKQKAWDNIDLTLVSPSRWLAQRAQSSSLFQNRRIEVIGNTIDLETYSPKEKTKAREALELPRDKTLILFGAVGGTSDPRKGFSKLSEALQKLDSPELAAKASLVVFGGKTSKEEFGLKNIDVITIGHINNEDTLAQLYSATDLFVMPSLEENYPNTVLEAQACGLPVVAFSTGGVKEMIKHGENGLLCATNDADTLSHNIELLVNDRLQQMDMSKSARQESLNRESSQSPSEQYMKLFRDLLK